MRPLTTIAILVLAFSAIAPVGTAVYPFTIEAEGVLAHKRYVDGELLCESVGPFRASTGESLTFALDDRWAGSFVGATACGTFAHGFDSCWIGDTFPQWCFLGEPSDPWGKLEIDGSSSPAGLLVLYERTLPDGTHDHVEGYAVWGV